jgi:hypothetical protein
MRCSCWFAVLLFFRKITGLWLGFQTSEVTNCVFGGEDTAGGRLWSLRMNTPGRASF